MTIEDWEKPRSKSVHMTPDEIAKLRVAFNVSRKPQDIARELKCSTRTAAKYYAVFRGKPNQVSAPMKKPAPTPIVERPYVAKPRFYKSSFEL